MIFDVKTASLSVGIVKSKALSFEKYKLFISPNVQTKIESRNIIVKTTTRKDYGMPGKIETSLKVLNTLKSIYIMNVIATNLIRDKTTLNKVFLKLFTKDKSILSLSCIKTNVFKPFIFIPFIVFVVFVFCFVFLSFLLFLLHFQQLFGLFLSKTLQVSILFQCRQHILMLKFVLF